MATNSNDILDQLRGSLGGLSFLGFAGVSSGVENILDTFTVGQYRDLVQQAKTFFQNLDLSLFQQRFDQIGATLPPEVKSILDQLFGGDNSIVIGALNVALDALAEFPANEPLLQAINSLDGSTIDDKQGLDLLIDQIQDLVEGTGFGDKVIVKGQAGRIDVGGGDDTVKGGANGDDISGGDGADRLGGRQGDDVISGDDGDDVLVGARGDDTLNGGAGRDKLLGGKDNDELNGGAGRDKLNGGFGNDSLDGGGAKDVLLGGRGDDMLDGGAGPDRFVFRPNDGDDVITDFEDGVDKIVLKGGLTFDHLKFSQLGDDVVIGDETFSVTVLNHTVDDFDASDFIVKAPPELLL